MMIPNAFDPTKQISVDIDYMEYADFLYREKVANLPNFYKEKHKHLRGTTGFTQIVHELRNCGLDLFVVASIMKYLEKTVPLEFQEVKS